MNSGIKLKITFVIFLLFFSGLALLPNFYKGLPSWWDKYLAPAGLTLGLDLQGGMHIVLQVDVDKAAENALDLAASEFRSILADKGIIAVRLDSGTPGQILFTLPNTGAIDTVKDLLKESFPHLKTDIAAEASGFPRVTLQLNAQEVDGIRKNSAAQALEIIRNRIDQFGVAEPIVLRQGEDQIVVQLPGIQDPERAIALIGQTAQLEFKLVANAGGLNLPALIEEAIKAGQWQEGDTRKQLNLALQGRLPQGTEIYFERVVDKTTRVEAKVPLLLESPILMTGAMVKDAQVRIGGNFNEPYVSLELTGLGAQTFGQLTEKNVGRQLAIVLDDNVRSAPVIRERILGGSAQITGNFTHEEASDLAIVLRAGALPAPVDIIQNLTVGASLGQDSINKGIYAGLFGAILVVVFMMVYYRISGVIANIGLFFNILLLFVGMAMLGATLTLPGIAGIILTVGMAVDANVLIYERMREEFALGKTIKAGVESGFSKAFSSIIDSQLTTLITALVLFLFGTGPIKGFAVTLSMGIIFNLFAVLFVCRLIYDGLITTRRLKELRFMQFIKRTSFDFMRLRNIGFALTGAMVLIGLVAAVQISRGKAELGIDFTGGVMLQYSAVQPFTLDEVRPVLGANGFPGVDLQRVSSDNQLIVKLKEAAEKVGTESDRISAILAEHLAEKGFNLESKSEIGSSVSSDLRSKAIMAIALSLLGVVVYLAFRFDLRFGLAATAATFHDVLAVLGVCWLLGKEFDLLLMTALLTLAGYSLNDTVVIFDRIRENVAKHEGKRFYDIINLSINETLSRSIITVLTMIFTVFSLFLFGGPILHDFSFALLVGMFVGSYSSIFVASPLAAIGWEEKKA